ncbi:MsnO8 family LLM class oxidoreductase [Bacillus lacus]|uniref:MsnO8 family LLM class oxidoreductase n=1 Tax=Metabacillus lacus TaxID=1983721 RepID=A0A7X2IX41_9BACI|nr:LLM class flavin-dependent oxidoreductase [Metabacillus lacus]MRX70753.1 MsnO8 family LLM class oxidoreductase [Metabacillus lacus]
MNLKDIKYSVLDLAPVIEGSTPAESFKHTMDLAQHAEKWGYHRYWVAEHHNMEGVASSATSVLIGYIAGGTSTIRVGSGGIMLPNHAPLVIAEQFGTLESMYPERIDLGLGRAPGTDHMTARALRRENRSTGDDFPDQVEELRSYLKPSLSRRPVRAIPGEGLNIPIWLLGSSTLSARLAGSLGLPFAFASHFSPDNTLPAMQAYRRYFQPSEVLQEPYAMVGANVIAADTDEKAAYLATSMQQQFLNLVRNVPGKLSPPVESMDGLWNPYEKAALEQQLGSSIAGNPDTVREKIASFMEETGANEIMINGSVYSHEDRLRSFELIADLFQNS